MTVKLSENLTTGTPQSIYQRAEYMRDSEERPFTTTINTRIRPKVAVSRVTREVSKPHTVQRPRVPVIQKDQSATQTQTSFNRVTPAIPSESPVPRLNETPTERNSRDLINSHDRFQLQFAELDESQQHRTIATSSPSNHFRGMLRFSPPR
jgi:hypothetical protein